MKPSSPVIPGSNRTEVVFAKDQPQYFPLPAILEDDGAIHTRWRLSLKERLQILFNGSIYLDVLTFNKPLQPVRLSAEPPLDEPL